MILRLAGLVFCFLGALALAAPAEAQLSRQGGRIQVGADQLDVAERDNKAVYIGNVDVVQGDARLRADRLTINFKGGSGGGRAAGVGGGFGDLSDMLAEGEVFYITPELRARGDRGVYTASTDTVVLTGNVIVSRGQDIAKSECLTLNITAGQSTLGCNGDASTNTPGERVISIFNPRDGEGGTSTPDETDNN